MNGLERCGTWTENPRVGGSIPPLATTKSIFQIKKLHYSARTLCLLLALVSNISVRCSLDQYGSRGGLEPSCYGPTAANRCIEVPSLKRSSMMLGCRRARAGQTDVTFCPPIPISLSAGPSDCSRCKAQRLMRTMQTSWQPTL
jgi:hypothetical protein